MHASTPYLARSGSRNTGFVEWEDTPSFADSLSQRLSWLGSTRHPVPPRLLSLRRLLLDLGPEMLVDAMRAGYDESQRAPLVDVELPAHSTHDGDTVHAPLESVAPSTPFREPLHGLAVREVNDADVFRHLFGG